MKKYIIALIALIGIILLGCVLLVIGRSRDTPATPAPTATAAPTEASTAAPTEKPAPTETPMLQIDPNAGALITPTPAPVQPGIAIPGWGSITRPAGVTEASTALQNPEANEDWYYLTFEMRLPTTDEATGEEGYEVLFTTGLIPPGQYCNKVTLNRPLEPGEYKAVVHVQPYTIENMTPTNNADMETVLIVE